MQQNWGEKAGRPGFGTQHSHSYLGTFLNSLEVVEDYEMVIGTSVQESF